MSHCAPRVGRGRTDSRTGWEKHPEDPVAWDQSRVDHHKNGSRVCSGPFPGPPRLPQTHQPQLSSWWPPPAGGSSRRDEPTLRQVQLHVSSRGGRPRPPCLTPLPRRQSGKLTRLHTQTAQCKSGRNAPHPTSMPPLSPGPEKSGWQGRWRAGCGVFLPRSQATLWPWWLSKTKQTGQSEGWTGRIANKSMWAVREDPGHLLLGGKASQRDVSVHPKHCMNDWWLLSRSFHRKPHTAGLMVKMGRTLPPTAGKIKPTPTSPCYFLKKLLNYTWPACSCTKSLQPCLTLCSPMNYSPPVSSVLGILQARILEWVAMPSSRGSSRPRDQTWVFYIFCIGRQVLYHLCYLTMLYFVLGKQHSKQMNSIIDILSITLHRVIL